MTEQKNAAPRRLSDEDLEAATGGAGGFNPLYGLSGDPYSPINSPVMMTGSNPLHVAPAESYVPPPVPQAHVSAPAPQPTPAPEPTVILMTSDPLGGGSLNIAAPAAPTVITASITISGSLNIDIPKQAEPEVTVLTFNTQPGPWQALPPAVVNGSGSGRMAGDYSHVETENKLATAFDLSLSK